MAIFGDRQDKDWKKFQKFFKALNKGKLYHSPEYALWTTYKVDYRFSPVNQNKFAAKYGSELLRELKRAYNAEKMTAKQAIEVLDCYCNVDIVDNTSRMNSEYALFFFDLICKEERKASELKSSSAVLKFARRLGDRLSEDEDYDVDIPGFILGNYFNLVWKSIDGLTLNYIDSEDAEFIGEDTNRCKIIDQFETYLDKHKNVIGQDFTETAVQDILTADTTQNPYVMRLALSVQDALSKVDCDFFAENIRQKIQDDVSATAARLQCYKKPFSEEELSSYINAAEVLRTVKQYGLDVEDKNVNVTNTEITCMPKGRELTALVVTFNRVAEAPQNVIFTETLNRYASGATALQEKRVDVGTDIHSELDKQYGAIGVGLAQKLGVQKKQRVLSPIS